jgi:hypothetical protein
MWRILSFWIKSKKRGLNPQNFALPGIYSATNIFGDIFIE